MAFLALGNYTAQSVLGRLSQTSPDGLSTTLGFTATVFCNVGFGGGGMPRPT